MANTAISNGLASDSIYSISIDARRHSVPGEPVSELSSLVSPRRVRFFQGAAVARRQRFGKRRSLASPTPGDASLPVLLQRRAEVLQMTGEAARIERIERLYILEKLIELGVDLQARAAVLVERVGQAVQC
jgi:hypothetical protein